MSSFSETDRRFMTRALELASWPVSAPHPNPRVGCLVVNQNKIVGEGFHRRAGTAHAEVVALDEAGTKSKGATLYVSLEPCAVQGRTLACVDRVIESGVKRVVIPSEDPNLKTKGQGVKQLRAAGIKVDLGIFEARARKLNKGFFTRHEEQRVWVSVKIGATLDGKIATAAGESKWITGESARRDVQLLRAQASAIVTGIGTVIADNPRLNCRAEGAESNPMKLILDSHLRTPVNSRLFDGNDKVIIATCHSRTLNSHRQLEELAEIVDFSSKPNISKIDKVNCAKLFAYLAELEVNEVLVEAGPTLVGSLLNDDLVDEMIVYIAPSILGDSARGMASIPSLQFLSQRIIGEFTDIRQIGNDLRITLRLRRKSKLR